jgi:hypothetical protein
LRAGSEPILALVHSPETGGSTLAKILEQTYGLRFGRSRSLNAILDPFGTEARLRAIGQPRDESRSPAVVGHFVFGMRELLPADTRYVTLLREPLERTLSHYAYVVARRDPSLPAVTIEQCSTILDLRRTTSRPGCL